MNVSILELQEENAMLRALLAKASSAASTMDGDSGEVSTNFSLFSTSETPPQPQKLTVPIRGRAQTPDMAKLASTAIPVRAEPKIRYYGENLRPKTPQEKAVEKQARAVLEAQWQGRQDLGYKATQIIERPTLTLRQSYEQDAAGGAGSSENKNNFSPAQGLTIDTSVSPSKKNPLDRTPKILDASAVPTYRPTTAEKVAGKVGKPPKAGSGKSGRSISPPQQTRAEFLAKEVARVQPLGGENSSIVDRKALPTLQQIPTDYFVAGVEVDPSKQPLPLTYNQVEIQTALVTGIKPFLPAALDFEENLREQRVELQWETEEGLPSRPQSRARSPQDRPQSTGPAIDYTPVMVSNLVEEQASGRSGSRGDQFMEARIRLTRNLDGDSPVAEPFLPRIPSRSGELVAQQRQVKGVVGVLGVGVDARETLADPKAPFPEPQNLWTTGTFADMMSGENIAPPSAVKVPYSAKGVPLELIPISSDFLMGIMNHGKEKDGVPSHETDRHHPLMLSLLVSAKPLWKTASIQQFDPNLFLTLFPPPPDKIVLSILDVVGLYTGAGVLHDGKNTVNNSTATIVINIREWTTFLYDLVNRYNDDYVPIPGEDGSSVPHVSRVFEPSSLEWWRKYARYVVVVRGKPNGQMLAKISRKLVDRLVQTLLILNSIHNAEGRSGAYDGVIGTGAGTNTHYDPTAHFQDRRSLRIHDTLTIHSWEFSHVRPVDSGAIIHQVGWGNLHPSATTANTEDKATEVLIARGTDSKSKAPPATVPPPLKHIPQEETYMSFDMQFMPDVPEQSESILDPESNSNTVTIRLEGSGITYENPVDETPSVSVSGALQKKKSANAKKAKKKAPPLVNSIPQEFLERNARFEISHMLKFTEPTEERSVGSNSQKSLNASVHIKDKKDAKKQGRHGSPGGSANSLDGTLNSNRSSAKNGQSHSRSSSAEHVPAGTPSLDHVPHGTHKIHTFAGNHNDSSDGVIVVHVHHDKSTAERMNSPNAIYKAVPNRSRSPGYYGNEKQFGKEQNFVGGYWNDNTDIQYQPMATLRSTTGGNVKEVVEPRPELFLDEEEKERKRKKAKEAKGRQKSPENKDGGKKPMRIYLTSDEIARQTIIRAREVVSTNTKFRTRQLSEVEAGLFRSPFAIPLVTEKMRKEAEALE